MLFRSSDGLAADLPRLARASHCGFSLDEAAIPRAPGCTIREALSDGEDFELLFALSPREAAGIQARWSQSFKKLPLTQIGCMTQRSTPNVQLPHGHDHFADA